MTPAHRLFLFIQDTLPRFGVTLACEPAPETIEGGQIEWGPSDFVGLNGERRRLYLPADAIQNPSAISIHLAFALLHELAHLVFWHPLVGLELHEEWFTAWESQMVIQALGSDCSYWSHPYTELTTLGQDDATGECFMIGDWAEPRQAPWFLESLEVARRVGCLDAQGRITWRCATWTGKDEELDRPWFRTPHLGRRSEIYDQAA